MGDLHLLKEIGLIREYVGMKRFAMARPIINECLSKVPESAEVNLLNGFCLVGEEKSEEAIEVFYSALRLGANKVEIYHVLAHLKMDKNQYQEAELDLLEALKIDPNDPDILARYGKLMFLTDNDEKAVKLYKHALEIDPINASALQQMFNYQLSKGNKTHQSDALMRVIETSSNAVANEINAGVMELMNDNVCKAREHYRQAYLMDPTNDNILNLLQELDISTNPAFFPHRLIVKVGGPAVVWVVIIIIVLGLRALGFVQMASVIAMLYVILVIYTWVTVFFGKFIQKIRKR